MPPSSFTALPLALVNARFRLTLPIAAPLLSVVVPAPGDELAPRFPLVQVKKLLTVIVPVPSIVPPWKLKGAEMTFVPLNNTVRPLFSKSVPAPDAPAAPVQVL